MNSANGYSSGPRQASSGSARPSVAPSMTSQASNMSRAQRFENEKQRIQESCFSKVDEHGQQAESYITHLRIEEDGAYPSIPPPPESPASNKKPRAIVVAVRSTGRVRIHKARENQNGSFSIGKTWNLEDMSAIESFNYVDSTADTQRRTNCQRGGKLGFTVTVVKPYYWQAGTAKERDFFIASLVKIFRKYTKGRIPQLVGFSDEERDTMFGPIPNQQQVPSQRPTPETTPSQTPHMLQSRSQSRDPRHRAVSRERFTPSSAASASASPAPPPGARRYPSQDPSDRHAAQAQNQYAQQRLGSQDQLRRPSEQGLGIRHIPSSERMRRPSRDHMLAPDVDPNGAGRGATGRLSPQSSRSDMRRPASPTASSGTTSSRATAASTKPPSHSPKIQQSTHDGSPQFDEQNTGGVQQSTADRWRPVAQQRPVQPAEQSKLSRVRDQVQYPSQRNDSGATDTSRLTPDTQAIPERKRPPIVTAPSYESIDLKPPPLSTARSTSGQKPPQSPKPSIDRMPGAFQESPAASTISLPLSQAPNQPEESPELLQTGEANKSKVSLTDNPGPSPVVTPEVGTESPEEIQESFRPGLGPMFKKKDVANHFRKAATTYNAFKPRAGGAGERLKKVEGQQEPDGVHAVVPAPLRTMSYDKSAADGPTTPTTATPVESQKDTQAPAGPRVEVQSPPLTPAGERVPTTGAQLTDGASKQEQQEETRVKTVAERQKPKRRSQQQERYLASLGIDPSLLEGRGLEFEAILSDFGWSDNMLQGKNLANLEIDLKRELGRVEAGSWLGHLEQKDERVEMVDKLLDRAISECEELDGLLTLYSVELGTLNEDISFIEAQSQGLQVQTANQKILHTELQNLVDTISIKPRQLEALEGGSFDSDLEQIEAALALLYSALMTIDPSIRSSNALSSTRKSDQNSERADLVSMKALQDKRQAYLAEILSFCRRLVNNLIPTMEASLGSAIPSLLKSSGGKTAAWHLQPAACNAARAGLWQYSPLFLFAKELNMSSWQHLMDDYVDIAQPLYLTVFKTALDSHKKTIRAATGDEADVLFTSAEKENSDGLSSTRKLTMKRSQTIAKSFRSASGEKANMLQSGRQMPCEAFADIVSSWAPVLAMEQNFLVELFHASSLENADFAELVASQPPLTRKGPADLMMPKIMEPDRGMAEHVTLAMQTMFDFWPIELKQIIEQSVANDPLQAVGILTSIAVYTFPLHESSQEFLLRSLSEASSRLQGLFQKFVDDQIRAIEDTKVKINKRKGVIAFMRVFPHFSIAVENIFVTSTRSSPPNPALMEVRHMIDAAYERILQAMWVSLKQIAREGPSMGTAGAAHGGDSEDKEVLNYHILLVENMNHIVEETDDGGIVDSVLTKWKAKAMLERQEHLEEYVKRVVRRPLGKLLDFLESTETLLAHTPASNISSKPSHSRSAAKKTLSTYDGREIRKGIEALRKRIEKHFGEADDEALSQKLVGFVCSECEREYGRVHERLSKIVSDVYAGEEKTIEIEWSKEDVSAGFRR